MGEMDEGTSTNFVAKHFKFNPCFPFHLLTRSSTAQRFSAEACAGSLSAPSAKAIDAGSFGSVGVGAGWEGGLFEDATQELRERGRRSTTEGSNI